MTVPSVVTKVIVMLLGYGVVTLSGFEYELSTNSRIQLAISHTDVIGVKLFFREMPLLSRRLKEKEVP